MFLLEYAFYFGMEPAVEFSEEVLPGECAASDFVQAFFHLCGELVVQDFGEVFGEEVGDEESEGSGYESLPFCTDGFGSLFCGELSVVPGDDLDGSLFSGDVSDLHVASFEDCGDSGCVG